MSEKIPTKPKSPKKPAAVSSRSISADVPVTKNPGKEKVSFFLDHEVIDKLIVKTRVLRCDRNTLVNDILATALSSVTFYDRSSPAPGNGPTIDSEAS